MVAFQRDLAAFEKRNAQVLGVSPDTTTTHEEFARANGIRFPLITDTGGAIARLYPGGRVTYLIDRSGTVRFVQKGVPDNKALLRELKKLGK
jgi:peroxiredoxin Q/BCP